jgi:hypothetical protein
MLKLTDQQLEAVADIARLIAPADRAEFLELLAERLRGVELGDGVVRREAERCWRDMVQSGRGSWFS